MESLIAAFDANIFQSFTNDDQIEAEALQAEEINSLITTAKVKIIQHLTPLTASASTHPHRTEPRDSNPSIFRKSYLLAALLGFL